MVKEKKKKAIFRKNTLPSCTTLGRMQEFGRKFGKDGRSNSFPPRRQSFDKKIKSLDEFCHAEMDQPASGPLASSSNSGNSSHARQNGTRDTGVAGTKSQRGIEHGEESSATVKHGKDREDTAESTGIQTENMAGAANARGTRQGLRNWCCLMSLVKSKLLSNGGKGRKISIVCGGMLCQTFEKTLRRYPGTLLTSMVTDEEGSLFYSDKVTLDRHPMAFVEILNAYREGIICEQPRHIAPETWIHELLYFQMHLADIPEINRLVAAYGLFNSRKLNPAHGMGSVREKIYFFLEVPDSSKASVLLSLVSFCMISISVICVLMETVPEYQTTEIEFVLEEIEVVVISFFTIEYFARFLVSMDKRHFVVQPMNIVDLMAILPLYLFFINNGTSQTSASKILRVLRVLRILKFSKYSSGLVVLGNTALACREQMVHLFMGLTVFSILFAAIIFFVEEDGPANQFDSIPHSMWWAVVTMLTIGYGDMFPVSNAGRIVGSLCAILGVVLIALPISVISNKFTAKFIEYTTGKKVRQRRLEIRNRLADKLRALFFSTIGPDRHRRRGSE